MAQQETTETNVLIKTLFSKAVSNHISLTMDMTNRARNEAIHELGIDLPFMEPCVKSIKNKEKNINEKWKWARFVGDR